MVNSMGGLTLVSAFLYSEQCGRSVTGTGIPLFIACVSAWMYDDQFGRLVAMDVKKHQKTCIHIVPPCPTLMNCRSFRY